MQLEKFTIAMIVAILLLSSFSVLPIHAGTNAGSVVITSDNDFTTCSCVSAGDGSPSHPYVISGFVLISQTAPGILIDNTAGYITKYFVITGVTVTGGNGPPTNYPGIEFVNIDGLGKIIGSKNTFNGNQYGILLEDSSNILIDGVSSSKGSTANNNGIDGIAVVGGSSNTIKNMQVNHNGIANEAEFTEGGVGIRLDSTSDNTVQNVVLSSDAFAGIALFSSSNNYVSGISVHYPDFYDMVISSGSDNTIVNNVLSTGDYIGLWLSDSTNNNLISSNSILSVGPPGHEINSGIVPYFTSGLYISSGASNNAIQNNIVRSDPGSSIILDDGSIVNGVQKPVQNNNVFNDPTNGNEPSSPIPPSGPAGTGNTFCGNTVKDTQGPISNPSCP